MSSHKEIVEIPIISESIRSLNVPLSPCVRANGFLFISGVPGIDLSTGKIISGDIELQTEASLKCLKHTLESAGSSMEKVVKTTVFITNSAYFKRINDVYRRYFDHDAPARSCINIGSWPLEFDIEIECIALA